MDIPQNIVYAGETFRLQTSGRYYQSGRKGAVERLLHRRIYTDHYGPIPAGHVVHHRNGNWEDNSLENLEAVPVFVHAREHLAKRQATPEGQASQYAGLCKGQEAAKVWHGSEEGLAWHSQHGKATWEGREPQHVLCVICGTSFPSFFPTRAQFCSRACRSSQTYQRHKTASALCPHCGVTFTFNKYRHQTCCSILCANRYRLRGNASLQPDA